MNVGSLKFPGLGGVCHVLLVAFSIWLGVAGQFFCLMAIQRCIPFLDSNLVVRFRNIAGHFGSSTILMNMFLCNDGRSDRFRNDSPP